MKYLVIVESPAKCQKIEYILNNHDSFNIYKVIATMGHITELKKIINIDIENSYNCKYDLIQSKITNTNKIKDEIPKYNEVILACDNDREGESIAYHICMQFNLPLTTKRIVFNEITESAIINAINNPTIINCDIVNSQKTRQILDLLVGYQISPILWKYISYNSDTGLSAGRCQTPALKLIYDNYKEQQKLEEKKVYNVIGYFTKNNIPFELNHKYESNDDVIYFLQNSIKYKHIFNCNKPEKKYKSPPEPLITSSIQQFCSNLHSYSPKDTMKICQSLYEGGYITYMRTDSKKYSYEFVEKVKEYILKIYGVNYINKNINNLISIRNTNYTTDIHNISKEITKNKSKNNLQDAHEAIRPTNIFLTELPSKMSIKEKNVYKIIVDNTLESCMSDTILYSIICEINGYNNTKFIHTCEKIDFMGWKIVSKKNMIENNNFQYLQTIKQNSMINYNKLITRTSITNVKNHYTEARLVQLLEEKGIGRPSTYSMLVDKIQERGYVKKKDVKGKLINLIDYELENNETLIKEVNNKKEYGNEKNKLIIEPLGVIVMELLEKHFSSIFNYDYTKEMEDDLDKVSKGEIIWYELCSKCNNNLKLLITKIKNEKKIEIKLDNDSSFVIGKYGPVIKTIEKDDNGKDKIVFKNLKADIDFHKLENGDYKLDEIIQNASSNIGKYENKDIILKKGKFGLYALWGEDTISLKEIGNRPIENIKLDEVIRIIVKKTNNVVREVSDNISIRTSKKGEDYIFFKTNKMKKPLFYDIKIFEDDYKLCDIDKLKLWIKNEYKIY